MLWELGLVFWEASCGLQASSDGLETESMLQPFPSGFLFDPWNAWELCWRAARFWQAVCTQSVLPGRGWDFQHLPVVCEHGGVDSRVSSSAKVQSLMVMSWETASLFFQERKGRTLRRAQGWWELFLLRPCFAWWRLVSNLDWRSLLVLESCRRAMIR